MDSLEHNAIGNLMAPVKSLLKKETLMSAAKLGAGAAGGIIGVNLLLSRVPFLANHIPATWKPLATAVAGILGAGFAKGFLGEKIATGVVAGTVGVAISQMVDRFTSSAPSAVVASTQEAAGDESMSGLSGGFRFRALGAGAGQVYGVGTPDMSAARMFNGATVAIEEAGGMSGATVAIEEPGRFAGAFQ